MGSSPSLRTIATTQRCAGVAFPSLDVWTFQRFDICVRRLDESGDFNYVCSVQHLLGDIFSGGGSI